MRKNIVAGNWKMNKTLQEGIALAKELNEMLAGEKPNCDVIICTPFIHLASVTPLVDPAKIGVGAENCADKESGAYTGEVSAAMVASTGAKYVILGHSERRAYYHETVEILEEKVKLALAHGLTPIFCIGEVLEEREAGKQNEVVAAQLASVFSLSAEDFSKRTCMGYRHRQDCYPRAGTGNPCFHPLSGSCEVWSGSGRELLYPLRWKLQAF